MQARPARPLPLALALGALALLASEIPYAVGRASSPPGSRFGGVVSFADDFGMYRSFLRQAAEGRLLFHDRFAHEPHSAAFFNAEFLAVGLCQRLLRLTDAQTLFLWRAAGALLLAAGFAALAGEALAEPRARRAALGLFLFGGGLGWAHLPWHDAPLDLRLGIHPFFQVLANPHFSLPHGLLLFALAGVLRSERETAEGPAWRAGIWLLAAGSVRPYDLLTAWVALPVFAALGRREPGVPRRRLLPLLPTLPALAYFGWLFGQHEVFRYWAQQGRLEPVSPLAHLLALGLAAPLAAARVLRGRLAPSGQLLLVLSATLFALVHAQRVAAWLPFSPQLAIPSMAPLVLLAAPLLAPLRGAALAAVLVLNAASSVALVAERSRAARHPGFHVRESELRALAWLAGAVTPGEVVLANREISNRIPGLSSASVVAGHYALTPRFPERLAEVEAFLEGRLAAAEARALLDRLRVRWIVLTRRERDSGAGWRAAALPGCEPVYREGGIAIVAVRSPGR